MKFECHIILKDAPTDQLQHLGNMMGWSYSCIQGDPMLGQAAYQYLTAYFSTKKMAIQATDTLATFLTNLHYPDPVVRRKVEYIVYDTRTG